MTIYLACLWARDFLSQNFIFASCVWCYGSTIDRASYGVWAAYGRHCNNIVARVIFSSPTFKPCHALLVQFCLTDNKKKNAVAFLGFVGLCMRLPIAYPFDGLRRFQTKEKGREAWRFQTPPKKIGRETLATIPGNCPWFHSREFRSHACLCSCLRCTMCFSCAESAVLCSVCFCFMFLFLFFPEDFFDSRVSCGHGLDFWRWVNARTTTTTGSTM